MEIWVEGVPKTSGEDPAAPRGAWSLHVDDIRFTQSANPETPNGVTLIGPQVRNGDFESEIQYFGGHLFKSYTMESRSPAFPAASGDKFLVAVLDPAVKSYLPRLIELMDAPDLGKGRFFVLTAKVRAREENGFVAAGLSIVFKDKDNKTLLHCHGEPVAIKRYGWTEIKLECDFDKGIRPAKPAADPRMPMAELTALVTARRAKFPPYDTSPRPDDGRNLALSVAKWEGRAGIPGKPFLVWAVGASWTAGLGDDGRHLEYAIRQRFPFAPPLLYKLHSGNQVQWGYVRGWVSQFVIPDQPDLIITYTNGDPASLEAMLLDIREHSTADIIVPVLHLMEHEDSMREDFVEGGGSTYGFPLSAIREVCLRRGVEFVENRRELAHYLRRIGQKPSVLRTDGAHQNEHGVVRTWDNIARHITRPMAFNYQAELRERRLPVSPAAKTVLESVELSPGWSIDGRIASTSKEGERIKVKFTGNRIDLIGRKINGGGSVKVFIDSTPADEAPVFFTTEIKVQPASLPWRVGVAGPGDVGPHGVELGANLVPQTWTITLTSDAGDYRLEGSVTGPDGGGNSTKGFTSRSGQIRIDPKLWRFNAVGGSTVNRSGDKYTFDVVRCAAGTVHFSPAKDGLFYQPLAQNLPLGGHTLEVVTQGDGEVAIDSFYVYQPPGR